MAIVFFMGRGGKEAPGWMTGIAHGLLGLQVALGLILLADGRSVVWYHPVLGIAAMLALGLTPVLRERLGRTNGAIAVFAVVAVLTFAAWMAVA
jgi:hypothetical protein